MLARLRAAAAAAIALLACSSGSSPSTTIPPHTSPPPAIQPCEQTGCDAGKYCDAATHLCRTGCATTEDCAIAGQACGADHVCRCPTDQHVCGASCVSSFSVETCGTHCTPCPEPTAGGHATCGGWLATTPTCGIACDVQGAKVCGDACITCSGATEWTCGETAGTCVATSCQAGYRLVGTACLTWSRTAAVTDTYPTIRLSGNSAIAIGPSGVPQIAWDNYTQGVWASTLGDAGWTATKVGGSYAGRPLLAIDTGGTSHVLYAETIYPPGGDGHTDLVYARSGPAGFVPVTIAGAISTATSDWVLSYALALDPSGVAHVAYWDGAIGTLLHAVRGADGAWTPEDVSGAGASSAVALAVDEAGKGHLLYRENATKSLVYVTRTDAGWGATETVDAVGGGSGYDAPNGVAAAVSLAVGADGQPRVAYLDAGTGIASSMQTWFARRGATTWTRARVYGAGTTYDAFAPGLALDSRGAAHLATADGDGSIFYHEPISATSWRTTYLILYGNAAGNVSLALDTQDRPHLAWEQYIETDSIWYVH
jgi:hypothetical protein